MFIHRWELGLLSPFVYCKQSTMNTSVQHLFESLLSKLWGVCPGGIAGSYDHSVLFCFVFFSGKKKNFKVVLSSLNALLWELMTSWMGAFSFKEFHRSIHSKANTHRVPTGVGTVNMAMTQRQKSLPLWSLSFCRARNSEKRQATEMYNRRGLLK